MTLPAAARGVASGPQAPTVPEKMTQRSKELIEKVASAPQAPRAREQIETMRYLATDNAKPLERRVTYILDIAGAADAPPEVRAAGEDVLAGIGRGGLGTLREVARGAFGVKAVIIARAIRRAEAADGGGPLPPRPR